MEAKHYSKSIITSPLAGSPVSLRWISVGDGSGIAEVTDAATIAFLEMKVKSCRGGISHLTPEEYAKKKSAPARPRRYVTSVPQDSIRHDRARDVAGVAGVESGKQFGFKAASTQTEATKPDASASPVMGTPPAGVVPARSLEEP